jgi:hypothetical protein
VAIRKGASLSVRNRPPRNRPALKCSALTRSVLKRPALNLVGD